MEDDIDECDPHEILTLSEKELYSASGEEDEEYFSDYDVSSLLLITPELETQKILRKRRRRQLQRLYCGLLCKIIVIICLFLWCMLAIIITFLWIFLYD